MPLKCNILPASLSTRIAKNNLLKPATNRTRNKEKKPTVPSFFEKRNARNKTVNYYLSIFNAMRVMKLHSVCGFVEESCDVEQLLFPQSQCFSFFFGLAEYGVRVHVCSCLPCGLTMLTKQMNFEHIFIFVCHSIAELQYFLRQAPWLSLINERLALRTAVALREHTHFGRLIISFHLKWNFQVGILF